MEIIQISSTNELESSNLNDCVFLPELSQPDGCDYWANYIVGLGVAFRTVVMGDFLLNSQTAQNVIDCLNRLTSSGVYTLDSNFTIASTENMEAKVVHAVLSNVQAFESDRKSVV